MAQETTYLELSEDDGSAHKFHEVVVDGSALTIRYGRIGGISRDIDICWLDIHDGVLGVSDASGGIVAIDHEDEFLWRRSSKGRSGWMVRCDATAEYHDERLYIVTTDGSLACIDASEAAIRAAEGGTVPDAVDVKAPRMEGGPSRGAS
jgi:hypothetical protein